MLCICSCITNKCVYVHVILMGVYVHVILMGVYIHVIRISTCKY